MSYPQKIKVVILAGGVGGAKLAEGFDKLTNIELSIVGNVADDEEFHGLWVSPDIDTITYTLSGLVNRTQGWGLENETHNTLSMLKRLNNNTWMQLGDYDFGLHIYRTEQRKLGESPSKIASDIAKSLKVKSKIILPTDDIIQTKVKTEKGWLSFQEYFVREKCIPDVLEIRYDGINEAKVNPSCIEAIKGADLIIIAPSNPILSIAPILSIKGLKEELINSKSPIVAVSPLIEGKAIKGPATQVMKSLGMLPNSLGIANFYSDFCKSIVVDEKDKGLQSQFKSLGFKAFYTDIFMKNVEDKIKLAEYVANLYEENFRP